MAIKLAKRKINTSKSSDDWREAPAVVKLRKTLRSRTVAANELFDALRENVFRFQRKRVKLNNVTAADVAATGLDQLAESIARDKSYRSNIVGTLVEAQNELGYMKNALSLIRRKVKGSYGASLRKEYKTITAQNDAIEDHFQTTMQAIKNGELAVKIAEMVIADIDQGGFNDGRLTKIGELLFHAGRSD